MKKKLLLLTPALLALFISACSTGGGGSVAPSSTAETSSEQEIIPPDGAKTFCAARKATMESVQYQYDFNVTAKIKFKNAVNFSPATYSGTTYVNTGNQNTSFLQIRNITGALVIDSTNYIYNVGNDLVKISADENKDFSVINHESVSSIAEIDKNNFSYILKKMNDADLLKADFKDGKYELAIKTNFSQDSLLGVLNFIDSKTIINTLSSYTKDKWGVGFSVNAWAELTENKQYLKKFHFDASVDIKDVVQIGFELEQSFTKYSDVTINLPTFTNTIVKEEEVKAELNSLKTQYQAAKSAEHSYYNYSVKTTVDHGVSKANPLGLAVNSTTKGYTKRQLVGDQVYFNNRLEVDSDYKNSDQLGDLVADYDSYRARLNNGSDTVYDVLDPKIGTNKYTELTSYDEANIDNYYALPDEALLSFDSVKVIKKSQDDKSNNIYKFGLSSQAVEDIIDQYNELIRIDYKRETIFDIYDIKSDFVAKKASFIITTDSENKIISTDIDLKGFYVENESEDQVKFRLEVSVKYDWSKSYTAVTTKEDIDNN